MYYQYILHTICLAPSTYNLYLNLIIQYNSTIEYKKPLEVVYIKVPKLFNTKNYLPTFTMDIPVLVNFIFLHVKAQVFQGREGHTLFGFLMFSTVIVIITLYCTHLFRFYLARLVVIINSYQLSCWEGIEDQG